MDQTIYLVRHAHANYQADERTRELSERGMKERQLLADYFEGISITAIVSSPYRRAVQTVETVAEKKGLPITCDERFRERLIRKGYIENFTEVVKQMWAEPSFSFPDGESNEVGTSRIVDGFFAHAQTGSTLISTHGNILTLLLYSFDRAYNYRHWLNMPMPALYRLDKAEGGWTISPQTLQHNQTVYPAKPCENEDR